MLIHTDKGEIKLVKSEGGMEVLPEFCFACELLSETLRDEVKALIVKDKQKMFDANKAYFTKLGYSSVAEFEAENVMNEYSYIVLFLQKDSERVDAVYEEGGTDKMGFLDYNATVKLEIKESKQEFKELILSVLEDCFF
ncbi:MAG: hypothetical protein NC393_09845 [Clostridium sp.]|nr:hypothetical protein [Clostridium sp.]MCM1172415.1 hypothetical protein [Clostridium sp.]MCM1208643.1 hypothetical protein [Ruminococcus sp.]